MIRSTLLAACAAVMLSPLSAAAFTGPGNVTVSCGGLKQGIVAGANIVRTITSEQQIYNNDSATWAKSPCDVVDGSRWFTNDRLEAYDLGIWSWESVGDVIWVQVPRRDGKHDWLARFEVVGYPAQTYELNRRNARPRMVNASDEVRWMPTHIYDARDVRLVRCRQDNVRQGTLSTASDIRTRAIPNSFGFGYGCDRIRGR